MRVSPWIRFRTRYQRAAWAVLCLLALGLAYVNRFIQDDAFISFVYAKSLVAGDGLTWFGTRVEGYTNFLWVILIAAGMRMGMEPIALTYILGMAFFLFALCCLHRTACFVTGSWFLAFLASVMFAGNYSVNSYATGGLETMMQTALVSAALLCFYKYKADGQSRCTSLVLLSLFSGLSILTRLDSAVPVVVIYLFLLREFTVRRPKPFTYAWAILPAASLIVPWVAWKLAYYGRLLPNTYYAKVGAQASFDMNGIVYLARFLHWYWMWPFLTAGLIAAAIKYKMLEPRLLPPLLLVLSWALYIVYVGGDFMEFRFIVPVAPFLFLVMAYLLHVTGTCIFNRPKSYCVVAATIILAASWNHSHAFSGVTADRTLDSIDVLETFYDVYPDRKWDRIGERLGRELGGKNVVIALHAVGAIPFYSGLETVDMWGLNDLEVPLRGSYAPENYKRPGHRRHATLPYLKSRNVNLVIGHPTLVNPEMFRHRVAIPYLQEWVSRVVAFNEAPIDEATVIGIPIEESVALLAWYLTPSPPLNELIAARGWGMLRVRNAQ